VATLASSLLLACDQQIRRIERPRPRIPHPQLYRAILACEVRLLDGVVKCAARRAGAEQSNVGDRGRRRHVHSDRQGEELVVREATEVNFHDIE
jgi:hypothetical protein